jgi:hypothetical protein
MRVFLLLTVVAGSFWSAAAARAQQQFIVEEPCVGVPVQTAIYSRRYGAVETEDEIALQELEAGQGVTDTFKFVSWRGYYRPFARPFVGYGYYGPRFAYGYGPRYYAGYAPRYFGYYPSYAPYGGGGWGGGWGGNFGGYPYASYYAPPVVYYSGYRGLRGYGGCWYW